MVIQALAHMCIEREVLVVAKKKVTNTGIPGLSFSAKRALGVTKLKKNVARSTGIPTTKSGMQRKVGKAMTGGCLTMILVFLLTMGSIASFILWII